MLRITRVLGSSLAILLAAGTIAPAAANASPLGRLFHIHPRVVQAQDMRISLLVYNKGQLFQDLKVDGHVYTVMPHNSIGITAPPGTEVYAGSTGFGHRKGELLFAVKPEMRGTTVSLN